MRLLRAYRPVAATTRRLLVNSYSAISAVGADLSVQYQVIPATAVGQSYAVEWDAYMEVGASLASSSSLIAFAGRDYFSSYYVGEGRITTTREFNAFRASGTLRRLLQVVGRTGSPAATFSPTWNIGGTTTKDGSFQWSIQGQGPGTGDPLGDPFIVGISSVAAAGTVDMSSPLSAVFREATFSYQLNGAIGSALLAPASTAISTIAAAGSVAMSSGQLTAGADFTQQYGIINAAGLSFTFRHTVNTSATADYPSSYDIGEWSIASTDLTSSYSMVSGAGRVFQAEYGVLNAAGRAYVGEYFVLDQSAVAFDQAFYWNVRSPVNADLLQSYSMGGRQFVDLSLMWRVGIRPAIDVIVRIPTDDPTIYADDSGTFAYPKINDAYVTAVRF
jgi:hypothetical protein